MKLTKTICDRKDFFDTFVDYDIRRVKLEDISPYYLKVYLNIVERVAKDGRDPQNSGVAKEALLKAFGAKSIGWTTGRVKIH